jgi:hypothetical protein
MVQIGNKRDFLSGLMLVGFGSAALFVARNYRVGTAFRMGPGYFPIVLSILLIVIGIIVAGLSLRSDEVTSPKLALRPLLIVTGATVLFGVFIDGAGMVLTTLGLVVASRLARPGYPWLETAILAVGLSALCVAVFYFGIRIQMPLLPTWWG